jgi:hypothetical protein
MWDVSKALAHLNHQAHEHSAGRCAEFVRKAVEAGGVHLIHQISAKDYGSSLERVGFKILSGSPHFVAGDVAIIQAMTGHPHGHMAMFNGHIWISDFKQTHGLYPGPSYRKIKPPFKVYRHFSLLASPPVFRSLQGTTWLT